MASVVLEQPYLDNYTLAYNINRTASSSAYEPSSELVNTGELNPSYNKKNTDDFTRMGPVWDRMGPVWEYEIKIILLLLNLEGLNNEENINFFFIP